MPALLMRFLKEDHATTRQRSSLAGAVLGVAILALLTVFAL